MKRSSVHGYFFFNCSRFRFKRSKIRLIRTGNKIDLWRPSLLAIDGEAAFTCCGTPISVDNC